ncbi:MAG: GTP cyclohydrolase II [Saprospiraceae bacterium]|nr:GTP cyclohydrolase II [Saprospiraceae bacterium]MBK9728705.1 GTP cyclohydrolase II [Saprospiraceae bacterium]
MIESIEALLPTVYGGFEIHSFANPINPYAPALVLISGDLAKLQFPLLRLHSECLTGDVFGSLRCDCGFQLNQSLTLISKEGGLLVYLRQEGRGIGLHHKIEAYHKQDLGLDTVQANEALGFKPDLRNYDEAISILKSFGIKSVRLLTNNPKKVDALVKSGIAVVERIPIIVGENEFNQDYLRTKREKLGHLLP